jgi:hypothetical protein
VSEGSRIVVLDAVNNALGCHAKKKKYLSSIQIRKGNLSGRTFPRVYIPGIFNDGVDQKDSDIIHFKGCLVQVLRSYVNQWMICQTIQVITDIKFFSRFLGSFQTTPSIISGLISW